MKLILGAATTPVGRKLMRRINLLVVVCTMMLAGSCGAGSPSGTV